MNNWQKVLVFSIILLPLLPVSVSAQKDPAIHFRQAEQAFEKYDFAQAEQLYRQTLMEYPAMGNFTAYLNSQIAFCLRYQKKTEEAVQAYRALKEQYPESPAAEDAQENIARTYYEAGNYEKAGPEFEKMGDELEAKEDSDQVKVASVNKSGKSKDIIDSQKKTEAFGLAAFCYHGGKKPNDSYRVYQKWLKNK